MRDLRDRVAVVTGAGSGLGRALALRLAEEGCHLALTDVVAERLADVAQQVEGLGCRATTHVFDVAKRGAWPDVVADVRSAHGGVQLLINNAGVSLAGPFSSCSLDDLEWQLGINLYGVLYGCHAFLPHLLQQQEARIVNVSSIFGIVSVPDNSAYCMAKHAVRSLSESLWLELADTSVGVTWVHPGAIATRIVEDGRRSGARMTKEASRQLIASGWSPDRAANVIVAGIRRGRRRIIVGPGASRLAMLQQFFPVGYLDTVLRTWRGRFTATS
ncbi:MAG: SDR family oxidoreductase [Myxococcota bacterium]